MKMYHRGHPKTICPLENLFIASIKYGLGLRRSGSVEWMSIQYLVDIKR